MVLFHDRSPEDKKKKHKKMLWPTIHASWVLIKIAVLGCKKKHTKKRNISVNMGTETLVAG